MSFEPFLPEDKLPECWKDEARINVLFAPFRNRSVNPKDWDSKLLFWKNLISSYCSHNKVYVFKLSELSKKFKHNGRSPACLNIVIDELHKSGDIKPLNVFLQKPTDTWKSWAVDVLVRKPVVWSFNKIKNSVITPDCDLFYVHLHAVETGSQEVVDSIPEEFKNKVMEMKEFAKLAKMDCSELDSLNILLHYLIGQQKASVKEIINEGVVGNITLVKLCDVKKCGPITDLDVDVYTLEQSEKTLTNEISKLENEISKLVVDAKNHLTKGHRQTAKASLRKKREVEKTLDKRVNALHNIQILLSRIQDADADVHVFESYKKALSSLRTTFNENGLSEESVAKTMVELEDVLEIHDDIQSSLARTSSTNDGDLEEELAELLATEENEASPVKSSNDAAVELGEQLRLLDINFPAPPSTTIRKTDKISL